MLFLLGRIPALEIKEYNEWEIYVKKENHANGEVLRVVHVNVVLSCIWWYVIAIGLYFLVPTYAILSLLRQRIWTIPFSGYMALWDMQYQAKQWFWYACFS